MKYQIINGAANYLLVCLNVYDENGNALTASEIVGQFGPCAAVAFAPTKKALVKLCNENKLDLA